MKELLCQNKSSGTSYPLMVTDCLGKVSRVLKSPDTVSEKITQVEETLPIRRQVVWRNYSEQMTEKQNSVKTSTRTLKKHLPYLGKFSRVLKSPDTVSEKITQVEETLPIRRQVVWRNYSEQMTEKQNSVKTSTRTLKKHLPYLDIIVALNKKGMFVPIN